MWQNRIRQKWESFKTEKEAKLRKAEVEVEKHKGVFITPSDETVREFLEDFVRLYGEKRWGVSTYGNSCAMIENYINPIIGHVKVQEVNARFVDRYIRQLKKTRSVALKYRNMPNEYLSASNIERIIKLLRCAFKQAVRWELIGKNPFENAILTRKPYKKRDIWNAETIRKALDACDDSLLYVAINLSFACSMRIGEVVGLTWDTVHVSDDDIARDDAWVYVDKELIRITKKAMEIVGDDDIDHVFEPVINRKNATTKLVLKKPKTDTSIRKIWLPKTVAYILRQWREAQLKMKDFLGDEYEDYNLVVALPNGRPCEDRIIEKRFEKLKKKEELPDVVFHSLRHSSATYKLKLNHGDQILPSNKNEPPACIFSVSASSLSGRRSPATPPFVRLSPNEKSAAHFGSFLSENSMKAAQGDTGHKEVNVITKVYAHILDEDRRQEAQISFGCEIVPLQTM